jgi:peptidoglycan/xylan/chitin deacetylase (PgdA/CDA1 family)
MKPGWAAAAGAACAAGWMAWAVRGRSSSVFGPSVWRGPKGRRAIALTFDDGPSEGTTRILETLERHRARATFFQCGANVDRLGAVAREVRDAGHEVANHGYAHSLYCLMTPHAIAADLERAQAAIEGATEITPSLFRAPFGARWFGLAEAQRRMGLLGVMWTVIGYDWSATADAVVKRVSRAVSNGAIVCLHDGHELRPRPDIGPTVEAVRNLVPLLQDRGYEMRTVSQLLCPTI